MMKKLTKLLSVILAMVFVFSLSGLAYADNDTDTPVTDPVIEEYTTISATATGIKISGVTAKCSATLNAKYSTSLSIKLELQKKKSSGYETVKTWTGSKTGTGLVVGGTKTINPLSSYRVKATYTAGSETTTLYDYP